MLSSLNQKKNILINSADNCFWIRTLWPIIWKGSQLGTLPMSKEIPLHCTQAISCVGKCPDWVTGSWWSKLGNQQGNKQRKYHPVRELCMYINMFVTLYLACRIHYSPQFIFISIHFYKNLRLLTYFAYCPKKQQVSSDEEPHWLISLEVSWTWIRNLHCLIKTVMWVIH